MHPGQLAISSSTVRTLVDRQFPQWHHLPVTAVTGVGTVNAIFRIGARLAARFRLEPEDPDAVMEQLRAEAAAARELAGRTRFPTPEPVALGAPGDDYPLPWSVQTWLRGTVATHSDPGASTAFAEDLAEFISALRAIDTRGRTFSGNGRGGQLDEHDEWVQECLARSRGLLDVTALGGIWSRMRELPRGAVADAMNHGDLIPGNVLVHNGRLAGLLDVGGFGPADPALDLVSAWHLLDEGPRRVFRDCLGSDELEWERGKAWAFEQAMGLVWYYIDSNPVMSQTGRRTLDRILADYR